MHSNSHFIDDKTEAERLTTIPKFTDLPHLLSIQIPQFSVRSTEKLSWAFPGTLPALLALWPSSPYTSVISEACVEDLDILPLLNWPDPQGRFMNNTQGAPQWHL